MCFSLGSVSPFQLVIIGTLFSLLISDDRDAGELNTIGNFIVAVGGLVLTIAAQKEFLESQQESKDSKADIVKQITDLEEKYKKLCRNK